MTPLKIPRSWRAPQVTVGQVLRRTCGGRRAAARAAGGGAARAGLPAGNRGTRCVRPNCP
ncbi:hypothetical protein ACFYVM_02890 [Streptomyces sp. NPDC003280]|uniref:hypothetical protein n=1 Tax=Streptomyces sp. NPDC003280 TaxID=3364680 RepID=UPI0036A830AA